MVIKTPDLYFKKGDSSDFNGDANVFVIENPDTINLTGWKAKFEIKGFSYIWNDIRSLQLPLVLTKEDTDKLETGRQTSALKLLDSSGRVKTILSKLDTLVEDEEVSNNGL